MLPVEPRISSEKLSELLGYDPTTGDIWWQVSRGPLKAGTPVTGDTVKVNGITYVIGRVAWCLYHGEWPPLDKLVDHKNGRHADNRIDNMRLATYSQNSQNKPGYALHAKGVHRRSRGGNSWEARIMIEGRVIELGSYKSEEEAAEAYRQAALKYHGEFACLE